MLFLTLWTELISFNMIWISCIKHELKMFYLNVYTFILLFPIFTHYINFKLSGRIYIKKLINFAIDFTISEFPTLIFNNNICKNTLQNHPPISTGHAPDIYLTKYECISFYQILRSIGKSIHASFVFERTSLTAKQKYCRHKI